MTQPKWSQDIYRKAWEFAAIAHKGQIYPAPEKTSEYEYITHTGLVTMELIWALNAEPESNLDNNLAIQCALLHDVIEDTQISYQQIAEKFGSAVAEGVAALSKNPQLGDKQTQMLDSLSRIRQQPKEIWMVKMADRICNLGPPPWYWKYEKIKRYQQEASVIHTHLASANTYLAHRLQEKIEDYEEYATQKEQLVE